MAMALPFLISAFVVPFLGFLVDRIGKRGHLMIISAVIGVITYVLFIFANPIVALVTLGNSIFNLIGFTYSLFVSVVWPSINLIVPEDYIGIALGFTMSLQNFGLVFFPMIIAHIYSSTKSYDIALLFFIFVMIVSCVLAIFIYVEDSITSNVLRMVQSGEVDTNLERVDKKNAAANLKKGEIQEEEERLRGNINEDEIALPVRIKNLF
jgi:MFS family permease